MIVHRDLKPENLLLGARRAPRAPAAGGARRRSPLRRADAVNGSVKIADFGLSNVMVRARGVLGRNGSPNGAR